MLDSVVGNSFDFGMDRYFYKDVEVQDSMVQDVDKCRLGIGIGHNCCNYNHYNFDSRNSVDLDNFSGPKDTATDYNFVHSFESQNCDHLFVDFSVAVAYLYSNEKTRGDQIWGLQSH